MTRKPRQRLPGPRKAVAVMRSTVVKVEPAKAVRREGTVGGYVLTLSCGHKQRQTAKPTRALAAGETTITCQACRDLAFWKGGGDGGTTGGTT